MLPIVALIIGTILVGSIAFKAILAKRLQRIVHARRVLVESFGCRDKKVSTVSIFVFTVVYILGSFLLMLSIGLLFFLLNSPISHA